MRVKEESEKAGLKLNIQKTNIMASGPITSWQIEGEKVEAVTDFLFLGSKITVDGDYSHEIKRCLLLGRASQVIQVVKNLPADARDARDTATIPGLGGYPRGKHDNPFQHSYLENPLK